MGNIRVDTKKYYLLILVLFSGLAFAITISINFGWSDISAINSRNIQNSGFAGNKGVNPGSTIVVEFKGGDQETYIRLTRAGSLQYEAVPNTYKKAPATNSGGGYVGPLPPIGSGSGGSGGGVCGVTVTCTVIIEQETSD